MLTHCPFISFSNLIRCPSTCSATVRNTHTSPSAILPQTRVNMTNSIDYIAIQNVLALYCFALDTKDLNLLSEVLTPDIDAQYPFPGGDMQGLDAVIATISKR